MHRILAVPGPAAKLGAAVVHHGLHDFLLRVHHERPVLHHGFGNRPALQQQQLRHIAAGVLQHPVLAGGHFQRRMFAQRVTSHLQLLAHKPVQHAPGLRALGGGQRPAGAGFQPQRPDRHIRIRLTGPGLGRRRQRRTRTRQRTGHHGDRGPGAAVAGMHQARDALAPQHGEVRRHHLAGRGQVQPDLEQLQRIGLVAVQQREHLRMLDALAGGEPLHIPFTEACGSAQRIGMVDQAFAHQGHGFEPPVRVAGEAGHMLAVVHRKAVLAAEIAAELALVQRHGLQAHLPVPCRVGIVVVGAEQKRIQHRPAQPVDGLAAENRVRGVGHLGLRWRRVGRQPTVPQILPRHGADDGAGAPFPNAMPAERSISPTEQCLHESRHCSVA